MKMRVGNAVHLQGYDAFALGGYVENAPRSIREEFMGCRSLSTSGLKEDYYFRFIVCEPKNVAWIMRQEWIIDFDICRRLSVQELAKLYNNLNQQYEDEIAAFNKEVSKLRQSAIYRNPIYHSRHYKRERRLHQIEHQLFSLDLMLSYLKGDVDFAIPGEGL